MKKLSKPCPACRGVQFALLADFGTVPQSGFFLDSPEAAYPTLHLSFDYCTTCALLRQNWAGNSIPHDYREIPRATSRQLPSYTAHIIDRLAEQGIGHQELIVEVGANDGAFLDLLAQRGFRNVIGIEPSRACAAACREKGHRVEENFLDRQMADSIQALHGPARAVICRHTLEHVPDPSAFLDNLRRLLDSHGIVFIEVPSSHSIIHDLYAYELWDEHLHIFSPDNLAQSVSHAGFEILSVDVWPFRTTENILLWATATELSTHGSYEHESDLQACDLFMAHWSRFSESLDQLLKKHSGRVSAIGASHPQTNFLLFTKLGSRVDQLIDDAPTKIGRYAPVPNPVPIISSQQYVATPSKTIILSAFGYDDWMHGMIAGSIGRSARVIRPYAPRQLFQSLSGSNTWKQSHGAKKSTSRSQ